jgi:hypothetical protein
MKSFLLIPILFGTACSVGTYGESPDMKDGAVSTEDKDLCVTKGTVGAGHVHTLSGVNPAGPRSGMGCLAAGGCHGIAAPGSTVFAFAGTAYQQLGGTAVNGGATVRIFPRGTKKSIAKVVTDDAGNFYIPASAGTFTAFPYEVDITACGSSPDIIPMIGSINNAGEANCSSSDSCHVIPGPRAVYIP